MAKAADDDDVAEERLAWVEERLTHLVLLAIFPPRLLRAVSEGRRIDGGISCIAPDTESPWSVCPDFPDLERGWSVLSGDVPDSCSHAKGLAQDPPREPGTHDPRHQAASEEVAVHCAHGLVSGSQS